MKFRPAEWLDVMGRAGDELDLEKYMGYLKRQVRELCTNYGTISGTWWDTNVLKVLDASVRAMIRELQPAAVKWEFG